jgi:coenzyme F420-0:L-glutamate ligase/coenzyme F420-1:gamma-L-glutamate ligase
VSRATPSALITRHRLGFVSANAGIDASNTGGAGHERVLLLPLDPDAAARAIRARVRVQLKQDIAVVVTDSHGRPFRLGSVGIAIGVSGLPVLNDHRGRADLHGRPLEVTVTALADQVAALADLIAGQADEGRPLVLVRGLSYALDEHASAAQLVRAVREDLYA